MDVIVQNGAKDYGAEIINVHSPNILAEKKHSTYRKQAKEKLICK